jgi:LacI family transcriptional regulator
MMNKRVTIADVAQEAGVSMMTVSRAINNKEGISEETRQRILEIAERIGYRPSSVARALATNRSCTIGLVIPDVANPFFSQIVRGAEDLAYDSGYNVFLVNTGEDIEREEAALNSLLDKHVDGAILCSSRLPEEKLGEYILRFTNIVLINRILEATRANCVTININDGFGAQQAVSHLISQGHQKIGLIAGPQGSVSSQRRRIGYQQGLSINNLVFEDRLVVACKPNIEGGYQSAKAFLSTHEDVTAIVAYNDMVAFGVYQACDELGKVIPDDIAIISFDDIPLAAFVKPSLSTLRIDKRVLGNDAMQTLISMIDGEEDIARERVIEPTLILRDSVGY